MKKKTSLAFNLINIIQESNYQHAMDKLQILIVKNSVCAEKQMKYKGYIRKPFANSRVMELG